MKSAKALPRYGSGHKSAGRTDSRTDGRTTPKQYPSASDVKLLRRKKERKSSLTGLNPLTLGVKVKRLNQWAISAPILYHEIRTLTFSSTPPPRPPARPPPPPARQHQSISRDFFEKNPANKKVTLNLARTIDPWSK
ncbi:hypothetical protein DPMN_086825 [Dreissena polymorpha]|uniref:Uncharacterized protein n=1 Tax=Dreissena polymorpha TaxID=45954 RepID=A0A9D4KRK9_DREPO|nr:hypothetical protein DPMN_086825 [Dreissena polymorpha]